MTSDLPQDRVTPVTWNELRAKAIAAARAKLELATVQGKSEALPVQPVPWDPAQSVVRIIVGNPRDVYWKQMHYYLVDDALDEQRPGNRFIAEYKAYIKTQGLLILTLPPETRDGLQSATRVRAFRVVPEELELARHWVEVLEEMDRGPRAVELWSAKAAPLEPWCPDHLPPDRRLNPGQQRALAAMSTPGGFYVWGPPGTGKTTVITSAVQRAVDKGQSVLITSHTNVAVDNVLKSLTEDDSAYGLGIVRQGQIVRHSGKDLSKVLPEVRDHEFLMLEKSAAVQTNRDERLRQLHDQLKSNESHQDRDRERSLHEKLIHLQVDVDGVRRARGQLSQRTELAAVETEIDGLRRLEEDLAQEIDEQSRELSDLEGLTIAIDAAVHKRDRLLDARSSWTGRKDSAEDQLSSMAHELDAAQARKEVAERRMRSRWAGWLPGVKARRRLAVFEESGVISDLLARTRASRDSLQRSQAVLEDIATDLISVDRCLEVLERQLDLFDALQRRIQEISTRQLKAGERIVSWRVRERRLRDSVGDPHRYDEMTRGMKDLGHWDLVGEYDNVLVRVEELDRERQDIERNKERLVEEFEQTKRELLAEAPILATTLTALSYNPALRKRRFDVVIIDESASAEAASVIYAAAKADATLAIVGDFLQNAPIAEAADADDEVARREVERWRVSDVFALSGITDRQSAIQHPRCVALSVQYRYPPIIADTVNQFCYDGLLESAQEEATGMSPVITFLDTSTLNGAAFSRTANSWHCVRTVQAAVDLASAVAEGSIGYVTPYLPQATAVQKELRARGLGIEAGTSHRFQGREFDTVIFDLMQDEHPRWVSAADLRGSQRAESAAKLLNVALTRAKKKLYLMGNWPFVRGHERPAMQALADLEGRANFEVVSIEEYLGVEHRRG